jgi:S-adenosylmethionine hydrolase
VPIEIASGLVGEVVFVDSFGNLVTNIHRDQIGSRREVVILGQTIEGLIRTYADRSEGSVVALIGSTGRLEVAVVNGDASKILQAGRGTPILVRGQREPSVQ